MKTRRNFFQLYRTKTRECVGPIKSENGELISNCGDMSTMLNNYFLSVFTEENTLNVPECELIFRGDDQDRLCDITINETIVKKEIDKLKSTKSPGPDELYPRIIKECKDVISKPLTNIFRKSIDSGEVPSLWKKANVIPIIFQKGGQIVNVKLQAG